MAVILSFIKQRGNEDGPQRNFRYGPNRLETIKTAQATDVKGLLSNHEVSPSVSPPAAIATLVTKRFLFAVADDMQPILRDTKRS